MEDESELEHSLSVLRVSAVKKMNNRKGAKSAKKEFAKNKEQQTINKEQRT